MNKLTEWLTKPFLEEDINLPVKIGDTILVGKFKNKKILRAKLFAREGTLIPSHYLNL
jgi:hypothetical protein